MIFGKREYYSVVPAYKNNTLGADSFAPCPVCKKDVVDFKNLAILNGYGAMVLAHKECAEKAEGAEASTIKERHKQELNNNPYGRRSYDQKNEN